MSEPSHKHIGRLVAGAVGTAVLLPTGTTADAAARAVAYRRAAAIAEDGAGSDDESVKSGLSESDTRVSQRLDDLSLSPATQALVSDEGWELTGKARRLALGSDSEADEGADECIDIDGDGGDEDRTGVNHEEQGEKSIAGGRWRGPNVFKSNESISGGVGSDKTGDGEHDQAIHPFQFVAGRLPTMIWDDGCRMQCVGDTGFTGDTVLPDDAAGSGSSVPGGAGVRSRPAQPGRASPRSAPPKRKRKRNTAADPEDMATLRRTTRELLGTMRQAVAHERAANKDLEYENLLDSVGRLEKKHEAALSSTKEGFAYLLKQARRKLEAAQAEFNREKAALEQAAAASTEADTPPCAMGGAGLHLFCLPLPLPPMLWPGR